MQFSDIVLRVAEETGLSITDDATKLKAWVNGAYQQLSGFFEWPWLITNFTMQTEADITTLTVSVAAGATAVTLSAAPTPATLSLATNYMIKFTDPLQSNTGDWYPITVHTANTTAVTLGVPFVGTTSYTTGTCKIRRILYSLPTNIDRLTDLRQSVTKLKVELIGRIEFDKIVPDPDNTGTPAYAYLSGMTAAGAWQMSLYPLPSAIINLQGRGYLKITEMTTDAEVPLIPAKWHNALIFLALALYGHDYIDDTRRQSAENRAKEMIKEMLKEFNPFPGQFNVIQPWDTRSPRGLLGVRLPSNYPWPWGV